MSQNKKTALVAPLNWGLGHATRCIPIIRSLQDNDVQVYLACDGQAKNLLKLEFPELKIFDLPALDIKYGDHFIWSMVKQAPKFLASIKQDNKATRKLFEDISFDYIISDNRYGVYHPKAHNVFYHPSGTGAVSKNCQTFLKTMD